MSTHQKLLGRLALQLAAVARVRAFGRHQVCLRRLDHTAAVCQRVAELHPQAMSLGWLAWLQIEGEPVQARRSLERERTGGLLRGGQRIMRGLAHIAGAAKMHRERLRVCAA